MGKQCIIPTREIQNMAAQLGKNPNVIATDVGLWQEKKHVQQEAFRYVIIAK